MKYTLLAALIFGTVASAADDSRELEPHEIRKLSESAKNANVKRAFELKENLAETNRKDLKRLAEILHKNPRALHSAYYPTFVMKVERALKKEKAKLAQLAADAASRAKEFDGIKYISFTRGLAQLVGTQKSVGILDEALQLLKKRADLIPALRNTPRLENWVYRHHQAIVVKVLLMYAAKTAQGLQRLPLEWIKLKYPAVVPPVLGISGSTSDWLVQDASGAYVVMVPNAGYVFGGNLVEGECKGLDCSSFTSFVTRSSVRMSTWIMEFVFRELVGEEFEEKELPILAEFKRDWHMVDAMKEYEAIEIENGHRPAQGDIVIWNFVPGDGKAPVRHAVLYVAPAKGDRNRFFSIECSRNDDRTLEGVFAREMTLVKENGRTFVLRRLKRK